MLVSMNCEEDPSLMACCMYPPPPPHMDQAPPSSNPGGGMGCGGTVYYCPSTQPGCCPPPPTTNPAVLHHHHHIDYFVYHHDYPNCPMTVPMVPTVRPSPPPMPMPVQVPVGHMVQQIVDETGQLRHVILSPQHVAGSPGPPPRVDPNQPPQPPADFFPNFYAPTLMPPPPPHGPPPPPSLLHPPGPSPNMIRDERSTRQYHKLKRRLEHKQQQQHQQPLQPPQQHTPQLVACTSSASASPPASPSRKPPSGLARRSKDRGGSVRGGRESSSSPLSPSDQSAPLSPAPSIVVTVSDIQQYGALLTWAPAEASAASMSGSEDSGVAGSEVSGGATPQPCDLPNTMYQVMVGRKGPDGPHKIVYFGTDYNHQLDDLTPGTEYSIKLSVIPCADTGISSTTILASFVTLPAPPSPPPQPKLGSRTKNTLVIKWNSSVNNGMPITQYNVEIAEGGEVERNWRQVYSGKERQCLIPRLAPGQQYILRVSATNQLGTSEFSPEAVFNTTSPPPPAPGVPSAASHSPASPYSLSLNWPPVLSTAGPVNYTLEMVAVRGDDPSLSAEELSKRVVGGYMPIHHGPECIYTCNNLTPATAYLFRVRVQSAEGQYSAWSPPVRLATPPTVPSAPARPQARGRPQSQALRVRWEHPHNCGGAPIQAFSLQLDDGSGFQDVWKGTGQEALVSGLVPGHQYGVRVCASNSAGQGPFSEPLRVATAPAPPGPPTWTRKQPPPSAHSLTVQWEAPAATGGSAISQYEVEIGPGDVDEPRRVSVYRGSETRCDVKSGLAPATKYALWVRAFNTAGAGPWSCILRLETAVAPPCAPPPPEVVVSRGGCATITWEPLQLAATYRLELAPLDTAPSAPGTEEQLVYEQVYSGSETKCELKRLQPGATYLVRLQGLNSSGSGAFSPPMRFTTMMSPPGAPPHAPRLVSMESDGESVSVSLTFDPPSHWGGDIEGPLTYQLEISVAGEHAGSPQLVMCAEPAVEDLVLALDTPYRVRVRAVNSVGPGQLSSALRLNTPPAPPSAPRLHLAAAMPRALRLSWEPAEDQFFVCVEARRGETQDFHVVYEGSELGCKVSRLREDCEYQFRAKATGKGGEGPPGQIHAFRTLPAPKPIPRGLRVVEMTSSSCVLAWQAPKPSTTHSHPTSTTESELHCIIQISLHRNQDYRKVYRGSELKCSVSDLMAKSEYWVRAAFVSADAPDTDEGQFCAPVNLVTLAPDPALSPPPAALVAEPAKDVASTAHMSLSFSKLSLWPLVRRCTSVRKWWRNTSYKDLSDQQKVFLCVVGFVIASAVLAALISKFI